MAVTMAIVIEDVVMNVDHDRDLGLDCGHGRDCLMDVVVAPAPAVTMVVVVVMVLDVA